MCQKPSDDRRRRWWTISVGGSRGGGPRRRPADLGFEVWQACKCNDVLEVLSRMKRVALRIQGSDVFDRWEHWNAAFNHVRKAPQYL
ncbi:hypothetical protein Nepgr_019104 [Nepenthes gracilis]|uniref:Uncharacterized protein n=1 Tax=Nepenthes gracilis TaxID=150966 RepID=A0AAD3XU25_NEPGR|nr:hypothetical protein Nepgr_019104 [Nepenthes gracilis]